MPKIDPLVLPTTSFTGELTLDVGGIQVDLKPLDIHSRDGVAAFLPHDGTLLAGDTLEDTVTYVDEPDRLAHHLADLARMETWTFSRILPNHGCKEKIANSGYERSLIGATESYVRQLLRVGAEPSLQHLSLKDFIATPLRDGSVSYFGPYEDIHRSNVAKVLAVSG